MIVADDYGDVVAADMVDLVAVAAADDFDNAGSEADSEAELNMANKLVVHQPKSEHIAEVIADEVVAD